MSERTRTLLPARPGTVSIEFVPQELDRLFTFLKLRRHPTVLVGTASSPNLYGRCEGHRVLIFKTAAPLSDESILTATRHLRRTVLHEVRHVWQNENWGDSKAADLRSDYSARARERDANEFADTHIDNFKVARLRRAPARSGLAKIGGMRQ